MHRTVRRSATTRRLNHRHVVHSAISHLLSRVSGRFLLIGAVTFGTDDPAMRQVVAGTRWREQVALRVFRLS